MNLINAMNLEKEFVPHLEALGLKKLGFNEPCFGKYLTSLQSNFKEYELDLELGMNDTFKDNMNVFLLEEACSAPTFSQAFRWFREKYNLIFQIFYLKNRTYACLIHKTTKEYMNLVDQVRPSSGCVDEIVDCHSYEEAELECLRKLIQIARDENKTS